MDIDYLLVGGQVVAGSDQSEPFLGTVAVGQERILWVQEGIVDAPAREKIDCAGQVVAPGFIDVHTHSDAAFLNDSSGQSQITQGVTTEIAGNCGHSCAPCANPELLRKHLLAVQDSTQITWTTFAQYLDVLQATRPVLNVASYVGHGTVRLAVKGTSSSAASGSELSAMGRYLRQALDEGAIGISTGLEYAPGMHASAVELIEAGAIAAEFDAISASHVRNRDWLIEMGVGEALGIARTTKSKLQLSHIAPKYGAPQSATDRLLEMVRWARQDGTDVGFDVIPDEWGPTKVIASLPTWALELPSDELRALLRPGPARARLQENAFPNWKLLTDRRWDWLVLYHCTSNPGYMGKTIQQIAAERQTSPWDCIFDLLLAEGAEMSRLMWCGRVSSRADIDQLIRQQDCMVISDGVSVSEVGPLKDLRFSPIAFSWAASFLQQYVRDQRVLQLVEAIGRLTWTPARRFKLRQRGELKAGFYADVAVFDLERINCLSSLENPNIRSTGVNHVFVNGTVVMRDGLVTDARSGKVLRRGA